MKKVLELKDVTYTYEGEMLPVWEHLSCAFYEGCVHVICGPSGCGKSSVLSLLNGLIPHMYVGTLTGEILYKGEDISQVKPNIRCENIGLVMQDPDSQFCTFTVEEELAFGMENLGLAPEEMRGRITSILSLIGMEGYEERDLNELSGGQKQKIAIASILVMEPQVLLLDEPTANLDPINRRQVFQLIHKLAKEKGITVILVEHNIEEILDDVDRVIAMDASGRILLDGSREEAGDIVGRTAYEGSREADHMPEPTEPILEIENLKFAYPLPGKKHAHGPEVLKNITFNVRKGDLLAIVGENGVGKTTLMKLLFRVHTPDGGSMRLLGKDINAWRTKDLYHHMGLVFQNPEDQFIANTVQEELLFSLKRVKLEQAEKEARVHAMLEQFHLEELKDRSPFVLSQGQKRRLSVAGMLLTDQEILFLDEPTFGQDAENRRELMKDMQDLIRRGVTIVMITHDLELVKRYATRVVEIENGIVKADLETERYFAGKEQPCLHT